ncbi:hypothetical protein GCM10011333_25670 [Sediminivirga luteola]|uniref:Uncharacterized protein n=1 Tax=Sediminivirga luteola TaxID=1774748 RepID=A0A8J2TZT0_9MICO|nr:hypothetical protein GCM10011333_25670 [Sediminivirga luteola]
MPIEVLGYDRAERQAERTAEAEGRADECDTRTELPRRQHVAKDRDAQRDDARHRAV